MKAAGWCEFGKSLVVEEAELEKPGRGMEGGGARCNAIVF